MIADKCRKCERSGEILYLGNWLCWKHWEQHCKDKKAVENKEGLHEWI